VAGLEADPHEGPTTRMLLTECQRQPLPRLPVSEMCLQVCFSNAQKPCSDSAVSALMPGIIQ